MLSQLTIAELTVKFETKSGGTEHCANVFPE